MMATYVMATCVSDDYVFTLYSNQISGLLPLLLHQQSKTHMYTFHSDHCVCGTFHCCGLQNCIGKMKAQGDGARS